MELNRMKKERDDAELLVKAVSCRTVDFTMGAYHKALDHVHCMYPEAVLDSHVFQFEHEICNGRIIKYHSNKTISTS